MLSRIQLALLAATTAACTSAGQPVGDAGTDAKDGGPPRGCIADFPCFRPWWCIDAHTWTLTKTTGCEVICSQPCTGETCSDIGDAQACAPNETCDYENAPRDAATPCIPIDDASTNAD